MVRSQFRKVAPAAAVFLSLLGIAAGSASAAGVATVEAENLVLPKGAVVYADSSASGGQAVQFVQNGQASGAVVIPSGTSASSVTVLAHTACNGSPTISLQVDGKNVLGNTHVTASGWTAYGAKVNLGAGNHTLKLSVGGTATSSTCNRSLYADDVSFAASAAPTPTVTLTANPASVQTGGSSTLTWSSTNASGCSASGAWSGSEPTSGSAGTGALSNPSTFTLTCTGTGGTASATATVTTTAAFNGPSVAPGPVVGCTSANAAGCNPGATWWKEGGPLAWGSASAAGLGLTDISTGQPVGIYVDDTVTCPSSQSLVPPTTKDYTVNSQVCEQEWVDYYAHLPTPPPILYAGAWWDSSPPLTGATATLGEMYTQTGTTACTSSSCGTFTCSRSAGYGYIVQRYLDYIDPTTYATVFYPSGSEYPWFTDLWATAASCVQNNGPVAWY